MRVIKEMLSDIESKTFDIGFVGEKNHTCVMINCVSLFKQYPDAVATMVARPPVGDIYPVVLHRDGVFVVWNISESDIANAGSGQYQLTFTDGEGDNAEIIKTVFGSFSVKPSMVSEGEPPEPIEDWLEEANEALAEFGKINELSASATTLAAGSEATAEITTVSGHKNIVIGVPKGDKGDKGDPAPEADVKGAVDEWLDENITNPDSPPLDRSLSASSAAAPADMVGDLKSALMPTIGNPLSVASGFMKSNGQIESSEYATDAIVKYSIPTGMKTIWIDGTTNFIFDPSGAKYCVLWMVDDNGNMLTNVIADASNHPQHYNMQEIGIQEGATQVWVQKLITVYTGSYVERETQEKINDNSFSLGVPYKTETGYLKEDGTIEIIANGVINGIEKYYIPEDVTELFVDGESDFTVPIGTKYCILWFVDENGNMIANLPATERPQSYKMFQLDVPDKAKEVWVFFLYSVYSGNDFDRTLLKRTNEKIGGPYDIEDGYLKSDGTIEESQNVGAINGVVKYSIPENASMIWIEGKSNFIIPSGVKYCLLWFVNENDNMIENGYFAPTSQPQDISMLKLDVPTGAKKVWVYKTYNVYTGTKTEKALAKEIIKRTEVYRLFSTPYTWTQRVFGLRMLADAQGCYFLPFNALGLGVNRGNGLYGNDYVSDQIHPTALGGYNIACGVWSYLKNIPLWHTSSASETEKFDGSQWNGKKWFAYGTSLSSESYGHFANQVAAFSGLVLTNKAVPGGALVTNRSIYNALLDMEDGKLTADLITIEVGANDFDEIGVPWSVDTNEFYGALNHCIKEMYAAGVQAQIVIMASYPPRYTPSNPSDKWDVNHPANS